MSDSDIYISFGGDTAGLTAALASAKASTSAFSRELATLAREQVAAGASAESALGQKMLETARHLDQARSAAGQLTQGHEKLGESADRLKGNFAGLDSSFEGVSDSLRKLAALAVAAFSIDKIKEWTVAAIDAADQVSAQMAKTGFSASQVQLLGGVETLAGASDLVGGLSTLGTNLQAITDGTDETSAALKVLGLTAAQLKGQLPTTQLEIIANAVSKFGDGATKTTALTKLLGSAAAGLIRTLDQGATGVKELEDATASAGAVLDAGLTQALARTHQHIAELNQAWTSGAGVIVGVVNPAIDTVVVKLTQMLDSITADKVRTSLVAVGETVVAIVGKVAEFAVQAKEQIDKVLSSLDQLSHQKFDGVNQAVDNAEADVQRSGDAMLASWTRAMHQMGLISEQTLKEELIAQAIKTQEVLQGLGVTSADTFTHIGDAAGLTTATIGKIRDAVAATTKAFRDLMTVNTPLLLGEYAGKGEDKPGHALPQVPAIPSADKEDKTDKDAIEAQMTAIKQLIDDYGELARAQIKSADDGLAHQRISVQEWLAASKDALEDERQDTESAYADMLKIVGLTSNQINVIKREEAKKLAEISQQEADDVEKAADKTTQQWQAALSPIKSAWNSQLRELLAGTESWATAMKKIAADLVIQMIESFERLAVEKAALGLGNLFGQGPQGLLSGLGSALTGGAGAATAAAATAANTAALTAQTTATIAQTGATTAAAGAAGAGAAGGIGGLFSGLTSLVHLFGFAEGTDQIMRGGLAMVHAGETIVPARGSGPYTGGGGGGAGGGGIHNWGGVHINTGGRDLDPAAVAKAMQKAVKNGAHLRR